MNSRLPHILLFAAGLLLSACGSDGTDIGGSPALDPAAITFSAISGADSTATRAKGQINSIGDLQAQPTGFGVFASYTGALRYGSSNVRPNFMLNQQVVYGETIDHTTWSYSPLKYWPNGEGDATGEGMGEIAHHVSFFAYAPWSDLVTTSSSSHAPANCITRCSETYDEGDPWLYYRIAGTAGSDPTAQQVDLLYAVCDYAHYGSFDGLCNIDLTKPEVSQRVKFLFHHALGCVGDRVTITAASDLREMMQKNYGSYKKVELRLLEVKIDYLLTSGARLTLWNRDDAPNWQADTEHNVKTTRSVTLLPSDSSEGSYTVIPKTGSDPAYEEAKESWTNEGNGVFYIPVEGDDYVQSATVTVKYCLRLYTDVTGDGVYTTSPVTPLEGSITIPFRDYIATSEAHGRNLNINIRISATGDIIATVDVVNVEKNLWTVLPKTDPKVYNW